ncbi:(d)CMP kinase [Pelagicoccus sp. SDUM812005]|uniref:(d)CMP kinase n=1 Tax=Pelagicoccus sp. SDUM812005 TaxID=3041257 RepID=UPI00280CF889|nr:(d)CMP kinase [Pelagicoccus sp. SDUM812005]MDQ8179809.1 (d)CMP kinase [Pelagicoccus sp. SDUM812005]
MSKKDFIIIAVDGGAAAGKSSTSRALSQRFDLMHVDTGSFYRATTVKLLEAGVAPESGPAMDAALAALELGTYIDENSAYIVVNDWIPDESIRSEEVNANVSQYAAVPELRKFLFDYQRDQATIAREEGFAGLIMEGRDIGSVIFPDADLRLYLYADPAKRAARRAAEGLTDSIEKRDHMDSSRKTAPLSVPEGATLVDSSEMTLEEVVEHVSELVSKAYLQ